MRHRRKHSRRRFHRNPSFRSRAKSVGSGIGGTFKPALSGVVGIFANNFLSKQLSGLLGTASIAGLGSPQTLVKIALPIVASMTIGKRNAMVKTASAVALSVALVEIIKPMLPASLGLSGEGDGIVPAFTNYNDGFRRTVDQQGVSGYTQSVALPSSIAN